MSCCRCHCSPCSCNVTEVRTPAPEARFYHFNDGNCCPIKGWYETLGVSSWTPPAAGASTIIAVCDATQYPMGTCVKVSDGTNTAVLKVTGWNNDKDAIYVLAYDNAENTGGTLSGLINSYPLAICPVATQAGGVVCDRDYMVTAEAFVQPTAITSSGGTVKIVFDKPQTLQFGMSIYVVGAGYMEVSTPPGGTFIACGTEFYVYNSGTFGNAGAGTTIASGAAAYPQAAPALDANADNTTTGLVLAHGSTGTYRAVSAPGTDADLTVTLTGVTTDDLIEIWGEIGLLSPAMRLSFNVTGTSTPALFEGVPCDVYDGDIANAYCVNPRIHVHRKVVMKATADGTVIVRWSYENLYAAGANRCSAGVYDRNLFVRVLGNYP